MTVEKSITSPYQTPPDSPETVDSPPLADLPIGDLPEGMLGSTGAAYNRLVRAGVLTLRQLEDLRPEDIDTSGVRKETVITITEAAAKAGVVIGGSREDQPKH